MYFLKFKFFFENGFWVTECGKNTQVNNENECESTSAYGSCYSSCITCSKATSWWLTWPASGTTPIVNPATGQCICSDNGC